jgi:hypothetical protein
LRAVVDDHLCANLCRKFEATAKYLLTQTGRVGQPQGARRMNRIA